MAATVAGHYAENPKICHHCKRFTKNSETLKRFSNAEPFDALNIARWGNAQGPFNMVDTTDGLPSQGRNRGGVALSYAKEVTRAPTIGKRVGGFRYIHLTSLPLLPQRWQSAVSQAIELARVSPGENFNVIKFDENTCLEISLLDYPDFDGQAFPALRQAWTVRLATRKVAHRRFGQGGNPPILHRKELLLAPDYPQREVFAALTRSLEEKGLLVQSSRVGHRKQWEDRLQRAGIRIEGHTLVTSGGLEAFESAASGAGAETFSEIARHKTAITRYGLSAPMQALAKHGYLDGRFSLLDYGCGKGDDLRLLERNGIACAGWDPHYRPAAPLRKADVVNLGFVLNVIESPEERVEALSSAFGLAEKLLSVAVIPSRKAYYGGENFGDGIRTQRGTFQKFFEQQEISALIEATLDTKPIALGPGVFFVFRDEVEEQRFLENRSRNRLGLSRLVARIPKPSTEQRQTAFYEQHREALDALWIRWLELGRRPSRDEVPSLESVEKATGTLSQALRFLEDFHGTQLLEQARESKREDLMVYFALQQFSHRKSYRAWPQDLRRDVREFFGNALAGVEAGKALLFSLGEPSVIREACERAQAEGLGWLEEQAFTCLTRNVERLPAVLRTYIGCGAMLYGDVTSADLVKIHIASSKLTLMSFNEFDDHPLPRMIERIKLRLRTQAIEYFEYGDKYEPPYLYFKSRFLDKDYPRYRDQKCFDEQLEAFLGEDFRGYGPSPAQLAARLAEARLEVEGYALLAACSIPELDAPCGRYFTFRDFVVCGETQKATRIANVPKNPETYNALALLARTVLDPVIDYFGAVELTYGFCSRELAKAIPHRIAPKLDQHAAHELNTRGHPICTRLGAAVDFIAHDESMLEVAAWIEANTPFDRLYYYGDDLPIHVSVGPESKREVYLMRSSPSGRLVPTVLRGG